LAALQYRRQLDMAPVPQACHKNQNTMWLTERPALTFMWAKDFLQDALMVRRALRWWKHTPSQALPYICLTIFSNSGSCSLRAAIIRASSDTDT
jgi:hypothetical protein